MSFPFFGTGGLMQRRQALAQSQISDRVKWLGRLSVRDAVVPEASGTGLPVICHEACGSWEAKATQISEVHESVCSASRNV